MIRNTRLVGQIGIILTCMGSFGVGCGGAGTEESVEPAGSSETGGESLGSLQSALTTDLKGRSYESKFEKLAHQLLRKRAQNKDEFEKILEGAYGAGYDHAKGEALRLKMARGDFSWAPRVQLATSQTLAGHLGAYAASTQTVYLDEAVPNQLVRAFIYIEEIGHHLDTLLNKTDAPGDEGTLFRFGIVGEKFPEEVMARVRTGNDHGTLVIDGKEVEVEFLFGWLTDFLSWTWSGIKTTGGWVWKGATTAGGAIKVAATKSWDGASVLKGWIATGAEFAADKYVELCQRSFWTVYQETQTLVNSLVVAGYGTYEGVKVMTDGVVEISKGNFVDGSGAIFVGLAKLAVEMPLDTVSSEVVESLSNLQTLIFLEPVGRYLDSAEKAYLSWVFWGGGWWLDLIRVKEGFAGIWSINPRPFTVEETIYLKNWPSDQGLSAAEREALMVHETTHVWQFIHGGGDYKLKSLYYQAKGNAYNWDGPVNGGTQWSGLNPEQQASFVESAYQSNCYAFNGVCNISGVNRLPFFQTVDDQIVAGQGAP